MLKRVIAGAAALVLMLTGAAVSGPFEDGMAAYKSGDYVSAAQVWRPLAEEGDPRAQNNLGLLYATGQGVPQDSVLTLMWFSLAAAQGFAPAKVNEATAVSALTPEQIAEAQRLVREWKPGRGTSQAP
jgi:TPR repeat protein